MNAVEKIVAEIRSEVGPNQEIVFVSGNFNIIHPGHLRLLNFAAKSGDFLVVGINSKGSLQDVYIPIDLRIESAKGLSMINYVFALDIPPEEFISYLKPDVVIKGKEHEGRQNAEDNALASYGGKLIFSSEDANFNSLDLLKQEIGNQPRHDLELSQAYLTRHSIEIADLKKILVCFGEKTIAVIGDLIVDEYIMCNPLGMSQEDPTIVVTPLVTKQFIGGSAIVAAHGRGLGSRVKYFSVVGDDSAAQFAKEKLTEYNVESYLFEDPTRPTPMKTRFRAQGKTLLRVNKLSQRDIAHEIQENIYNRFCETCADIDALIFSDFNYGCLPQPLVDKITKFCKEKNIEIFGDSQSSSQIGNISRFKDTLAITPTEREARLALHDFNSGLVVLAEKLKIKSNTKNVVMTLGEEGVMVYAASKDDRIKTDKLPTMNNNPKDVTGAGDSFLTTMSLALICGANIWEGCYMASISAGLQVGRIGNTPLNKDDILAELDLRL